MAIDMGESTAKISGNAQLSSKAAADIGNAFLKTAGQSTFSGKAMSDAFGPVAGVLQSLIGHTLTQADALGTMKVATGLAEATGKDLTTTTASLISVMQGFGIKLSGASDASNVLFNTSRLTNIGLDTLSATVVKLHGRLGTASPSLKDTSALLVDLAQHGISGSRGVLLVNTGLTTLLGGSKSTDAALKALGMSLYDSSGKFVGMQSVLGQLTPKLSGMTDEQRRMTEGMLFGKSAAAALDSTIMGGVVSLGKATNAVMTKNAVDIAAQALADSTKGKLEKLTATYADLLTMIGEKIVPVVMSVVTWMTKHKLAAEILAGVIGVGLLTATALWTASLFAAGGALAFVTAPILAIAVGLSALAVGVIYAYNHFKIFHDIVNDIFRWLKDIVVGTIDFVKAHWDLIVGIFLGPIGLVAAELIKHWHAITSAVSTAIGDVIDFFKHMPSRILSAVGDLGNLLLDIGSSIFTGLWDGMKSAWKHVTGWLSGLGKTIASLKGPIEYDRGLLIPHGNAIMDGLNEGLVAGFARVMANVQGMAGQLSSGFNASVNATVSGRMSENGGPVTSLVRASTGSLDSASALIRASAVATTGRMSENGGPGATSDDIAVLTATVASLAKSFDASLINQANKVAMMQRQGI